MKTNQNKTIPYFGIVAAACLMYAVSAGLRSVYGIMLGTIAEETGIAYAVVSFAIAMGQLAFGIAQPLFGVVALKKSNTFVLVLGCILMAVGLVMIPFCTTEWMLMFFLGILLPVGTGGVSFGIIMGAITPKLGEKKAATASGLVNASSGVGSIVFSPIIQTAFSSVGLKPAMLGFGLLAAILIPVAIVVSRTEKKEPKIAERMVSENKIIPLMKKAVHSRSYLFLIMGFFTCGFHMAIIETHLYSQILSYGIQDSIAAIAFSIYGFALVAGSLGSGFLCGKMQMKNVAGFLYGSRVVMVLAFLLLPKNVPMITGFAILLGLTSAATVVPTSGLVGKLFGSENLATLFGIVFLSHQLGSFFSSWLGGICLSTTGGYVLIWCADAVLCMMAAIVSFMIKEK